MATLPPPPPPPLRVWFTTYTRTLRRVKKKKVEEVDGERERGENVIYSCVRSFFRSWDNIIELATLRPDQEEEEEENFNDSRVLAAVYKMGNGIYKKKKEKMRERAESLENIIIKRKNFD